MVLMTLMRNEPRRAYQKLVTAKPSMKEAAKRKSAALMTKVNRPRVSKVIGSVRMTRMGFKIALKTPRIRAAMTAV